MPDGSRQTLTVPAHRELDTGTCRAILRQASRYVPYEELAKFLPIWIAPRRRCELTIGRVLLAADETARI